MIKSLEYIANTYGSVEKYVVDNCGVSPEHVKRLRQNLTVDVSATEPVVDWREHAKIVLGEISPPEPSL